MASPSRGIVLPLVLLFFKLYGLRVELSGEILTLRQLLERSSCRAANLAVRLFISGRGREFDRRTAGRPEKGGGGDASLSVVSVRFEDFIHPPVFIRGLGYSEADRLLNRRRRYNNKKRRAPKLIELVTCLK